MTRTIKASEIKPGMTIRWEDRRFTHEGPVERVTGDCGGHGVRVINGARGMSIWNDTDITVLVEPQPKEPAPGSIIRIAGESLYCRVSDADDGWRRIGGIGVSWCWSEILELSGPIEIVFDAASIKESE